MSGWDAYINALRGNGSDTIVTGAAIYGQGAPPALWAASSATFIKKEEVEAIYKALKDETAFNNCAASGIIVNGVKFMTVNSELGSVLRGKKGEEAFAAALSKKAIVIGVGKASPQETSNKVEKMAADLASKGF